MRRPLSLWLPVVLWAALIFTFSSIPDLGSGIEDWDFTLRKIAHALEYAVLAILLLRVVRSPWAAVGLATLYAVTDEWHQSFVEGRRGSPRDVVIDAVGAAIGVLVWIAVTRRRERGSGDEATSS